MSRRPLRWFLLLACVSPALAAFGCSKQAAFHPLPNQRPVVTLTEAPAGGDTPYFYSYEVRWSGFDPDGRVDQFLYAVDPPSRAGADTAWTATVESRRTFLFPAGDPDSVGIRYRASAFHVLVVKAVDDRGLASEPAVVAFFSSTVAPDVRITDPAPSHLIAGAVPTDAVIRWSAHDPDGIHSGMPVLYKYKLFKEGESEFDVAAMIANPDSVRQHYAPAFAGWDSTTATSVREENLVPQSKYVFVVVAFDEAGAYSPVFSFDLNMLYFQAQYPSLGGPVLTMYNELFRYTYAIGAYSTDPSRYVRVEIPGNSPVTVYWSAISPENARIKQYRWALDIQNLDDPNPRTGPNDFRHWSLPALSETQATVGPFTGTPDDAIHTLFIEAEDSNGLRSLGIVSLQVVRPLFDRALLFVNDTRFALDQGLGRDSILTAIGAWPCEAELDTFLYARGGMPWRYYPPGSRSTPGIFLGYGADTLMSYRMPGSTVPISTLFRYRNVVWMTNATAWVGTYLPSLQTMTLSGNTLSLFARVGGRVWLMGGGGARATLLPFNQRSNDLGGATVFSPDLIELVPGRFMYDLAWWRSEISCLAAVTATRNPALVSTPGAADYSSLPRQLRYKDDVSDPLPPLRSYDQFYTVGYDVEYLSKPNTITEGIEVRPDSFVQVPVLDTLYYTVGQIGPRPVMTLYRGHQGAQFLFSGFPLWYFSRPQAMALGDWVLGTLWGLPRQPLSRDVPAAAPRGATRTAVRR